MEFSLPSRDHDCRPLPWTLACDDTHGLCELVGGFNAGFPPSGGREGDCHFSFQDRMRRPDVFKEEPIGLEKRCPEENRHINAGEEAARP